MPLIRSAVSSLKDFGNPGNRMCKLARFVPHFLTFRNDVEDNRTDFFVTVVHAIGFQYGVAYHF